MTVLLLAPALALAAGGKAEQSRAPLPEVRYAQKTLHHGSPVPGITRLDRAGSSTVGSGVYFTSQKVKAAGYARLRVRDVGGGTATVYTTRMRNLRLADLRTDAAMETALQGFAEYLHDELEQDDGADDPMRRSFKVHALIDIANQKYRLRSGIELKQITGRGGMGRPFSQYLAKQGFDGLLTLEGGEADRVENIGNHDSIVIFDPAKVGRLTSSPATPGPTAPAR